MKKNKFEKGLKKAVSAIEAGMHKDASRFLDLICEGVDDPNEIMAKEAAAVATRLYAELDDNMNPQKWA